MKSRPRAGPGVDFGPGVPVSLIAVVAVSCFTAGMFWGSAPVPVSQTDRPVVRAVTNSWMGCEL
jgi:hypothetical protein